MLKKREMTNLAMPLPQGVTPQKMIKTDWSGLNYRQVHDTGELSHESNISTSEAPYLTPSQNRAVYKSGYINPVCMYGFDDFLLVVYISANTARLDYITANGTVYSGNLGGSSNAQRSIVKFNVYDTPTDPIGGNYVQKLLIFPDKKSMDFKITANFTPANMSAGISQVPDIKYATVHLSRLFGVDDDRIYASAFNDYANWALDTIDEHSASNAWASPAQANTKANGAFTAITTFMNHVICFKRDFMHELYNNKNPFRIQDIFAEGTIDHRSIQDVNGRLIFVCRDGVKVYTGGNPRDIGYNLGVNSFSRAVAGTDGRRYYLFCATEKKARNLFVYDTLTEQWAEESIDTDVLSFAQTSTGMYMFCTNGIIYKLDTGDYSHYWSFETDYFMGQTVDVKHIQKIQLYAEIGAGSIIDVYLLYDDEIFDQATAHKIYSYTNAGGAPRKIPVRVIPRQTANYGFKLRVNGYGYSRLHNLETFLRQGGDLYT